MPKEVFLAELEKIRITIPTSTLGGKKSKLPILLSHYTILLVDWHLLLRRYAGTHFNLDL